MKAKRFLTSLLALALVGSLAACGGGGNSDSNAPKETMPNGDVLDADQTYTTFLQDEPATLDSTKCYDIYGDAILVNVLEPLIRLEEDAEGNNVVTPAGAESWEPNEDGSVWTFHLRENTWSDGVAVKAQDYAYGIQRVLDPSTGSPNSFLLTSIKNGNAVNAGDLPVDQLGVKAIDDKTLEITLEGPTPYFLTLVYSKAMYPIRQDMVEQYGETYGANLEGLVFNGPFIMTNWVHNSEINLAKNDKYWDKDSVKLQTVNYKILTDENTRYNSFENGSIESVTVGQPEWIEKFNQKENAAYTGYVTPSIRFHFFNTKDPMFANENMRKAFALALNREDIVDTIYHGTMAPSYSWVPQGVSSGEAGDFRASVPEPLMTLRDENPDAKALLLKGMEELGLGSDPSALNIKMTMGGTTQWLRNYGEYLQQVFKTTLGMQIELEFNEWATFQSKINTGDYQMGYMVWSIDYNDPMSMLALMTSDSNAIPTGWSNAEYDRLVAEASLEMDDQKRMELYKQAEYILLHDDTVLAPAVNETVNRFAYSYVKGLTTNYFSGNSSGLKNVYISGRS